MPNMPLGHSGLGQNSKSKIEIVKLEDVMEGVIPNGSKEIRALQLYLEVVR